MPCYDSSPYTCTYDSGGGKDYTSLSTWETDSDLDLSGYSGPVVLDCYDSQSHNDTVTLANSTNTSTTIYRKVQSASGCAVPFAGKAGTGAAFYYNFAAAGNVLSNAETYAVLKNLCVTGSCDSGAVYYGIAMYTQARVMNCVVYDCVNADASMRGIGSGQVSYILIMNCIAYGCDGEGIRTQSNYRTGHMVLCNTSIGNLQGIWFQGNGSYPASGNAIFSNYCADNSSGDFALSALSAWGDLDLNSWNSSKDNTAPGNNYKRSNNLTDTELDADYLPTVANLFWTGGSTDNAGRNPYNDVSATNDWEDFLKNDADGWPESKKDIRSTDRPTPDTADVSWSVGAAEYVEPPPAPASSGLMMWIF